MGKCTVEISYRYITNYKIDNTEVKDGNNLNSLWFKFGSRPDYFIFDYLFLRVEFFYGFRMENKLEKDLIQLATEASGGLAKISNIRGHGMEIKLSIGFTL